MALWSFTAREMGKWQGGAFLAYIPDKDEMEDYASHEVPKVDEKLFQLKNLSK